ncbi:MAG TPA: DnaJ domain-containing protein [Candidatus Acidoferrales bacterium]|nr:DnaJ domain-containing protein [Candidatus Acidoferrales bacterium]
MFVKTKRRDGRTYFFLCIAERGGNTRAGGRSGKEIEHSVCVGETLDLAAQEWVEILRSSATFRSASLRDVLEVAEQYAAGHGIRPEILGGLREAAGYAKGARPGARSERRSQTEERVAALRVLGLGAGASNQEIELAFRKEARRHHPDVGGDPAKFRAVVNARDFLLGADRRANELI